MIAIPQMRGAVARRRSSGGGTDPYFAYVVQLTHFDVDAGGGTFTQTVGPGAFANGGGDAALDTSEKAYGAGSVGLTTVDVLAASHAAYTIGTADFALELWVRPLTVSGAQVYFDGRPGSEGPYPTIYAVDDDLFLYTDPGNKISGTSIMTALIWQYLCLARTSGVTRLYHGVKGGGTAAQVGSDFSDSTNYLQMPLRLARTPYGSGPAPGNYDDFRLTIGHGRGYTGSSIPVPTAAFPNS